MGIVFAVSKEGLGVTASIGELLLEMVLFPAAVIGLFVAADEFKKAQATPDLDLHWQPESDETAREFIAQIPSYGARTNSVPLVLSNEGNAVSTWYLIKIRIPGEIFGNLSQPTWGITGPMQGVPHDQVGNWRVFIPKDGKEVLCEFMSGGQVAAFPDNLQFLANLHLALKADQHYPRTCQVEYTIAADRMRRKGGVLTIQILPEEAEKGKMV